MSLRLGATNATGVQSLVSETLLVDTEPVRVALSMPNDTIAQACVRRRQLPAWRAARRAAGRRLMQLRVLPCAYAQTP